MCRVNQFVAWCIVAMLVATVSARSQESLPSVINEEEDVTVVKQYAKTIVFHVRDKKQGVPVADLPFERFRLEEEIPEVGRQNQTILSIFSSQTPLLCVLVVDTSNSVFQQKKQALHVKELLKQFAALAIRPGRDAALLLPFNTLVDNSRHFTDDLEVLKRDIDALTGRGATSLFDALLVAVDRLETEERRRRVSGDYFRKAIILLSDGEDVASRGAYATFGAYERKQRRTEELLIGTNAPMYALYPKEDRYAASPLMQWGADGIYKSKTLAIEWLRDMASATGGSFYPFLHRREQDGALRRITEELRHSYWLFFYPHARIEGEISRKIWVRVMQDEKPEKVDKRYSVRSPQRFFFTAPTAPSP